jgi:hypothetical protein
MRRPGDHSREAISKVISAILRRDATKFGIDIDGDGWVKVTDILKAQAMKGVDELKFHDVVRESNEQKLRYELADTPDGQAIRAINKRKIDRGATRLTEFEASSPIMSSPVMMSVSGLHGTICEVSIPQDSTVMDARKAISDASGIPIQKQTLIRGCTQLTDSSTVLTLGPSEEQIHVTCIQSACEPADICTWCCKVLGVPVQFKCSCKTLYCLTCVRDMVGMNGQPPKCQKCPTCSKRFPSGSKASSVYTKRLDLINHLDDRYGKLECPRGCGQSYHRSNAQDHMQMCSRTVKICRSCNQSYTGHLAAHQQQGCGIHGVYIGVVDPYFDFW